MALFSKNTLQQVAGFDNPILAGELVWDQKTYWNLTVNTDGVAVDITGATIDAQIIRRQLSNLIDTRNGLAFDIADYTISTPTAIPLTIANRDDANGKFTLVIDDSAWSLVGSDTQLDINASIPVGFSGRIKISFPAVGTTPAEDKVIFLLFIIRSDALVN